MYVQLSAKVSYPTFLDRLRITREARCGHLDFSLSILIRAKMRKVKILTRQVETITRKGEISTCVIIFNFSTMKFI